MSGGGAVRIDEWEDEQGLSVVELSVDAADRGAVPTAVPSSVIVREIDGSGATRFEGTLPGAVVVTALRRYGRPLDVEPAAGAVRGALSLDGGEGVTIEALRHRSPVDVIANDWVVLRADGAEALAAPARLVSSALRRLARAVKSK